MGSFAIESVNLRRFFREKEVLGNVSFSVRKGEIFGLLGPNGSGKTTLTRILATLLLPSSGRALVEGFDVVKDERKVREIIGVYLAESGFYYRLKTRDFLYFFGRLYGVDTRELKNRAKELLRFFQLEEKADEEVNSLSHGMRRKLHLARALLHNPSVLLLDEPTIGLDPTSAKDLRDKLENLSKEGVTILYTTHYMPEAERFCDRVLFLNMGTVIAIDTPGSLISQYGGFQVIEALCDQASLSESAEHLQSLLRGNLENEAGASVHILNNERLKVYSRSADRSLADLVNALQRYKVQVRNISVSKPTLEDVFHILVSSGEKEEK